MNKEVNSMGKSRCKCCAGNGIQYNQKTGLWERCPCCYGTGKWEVDK